MSKLYNDKKLGSLAPKKHLLRSVADDGKDEAIASYIRELEKRNEEIHASRRAAVNALEDAILSKEALRISEEKYRTLFELIDEGFCIIEVLFSEGGKASDYRFLEANKSFEKQTGLTNVVGKTMKELVPDHEQHWYEIYGRIAKTGEPERFESAAKAIGHYYDVYAFRIGEPKKCLVAVLFNDITERKKTEDHLQKEVKDQTKQLKEQDHLIRRVTDVMPDLLSVIDLKTITARFINKKVLLEMGFNDLENMSDEERAALIYPDDQLLLKKYFDELSSASDDEVIDVEYRARIKTGEWQWFHAKGKVFSRDETGKPTHCVNIVQNINKRKNSESQIEELNRDLLQKNRQLGSLNAELKTFNGLASNNYAETLRNIYINLETIATTDAKNLTNSNRANLRRVQSAVQKMKLLTNDINHYLALYDVSVKKEIINLNVVLLDIKERMQKKLEDSNATIHITELPRISADPILVSKLMIHLIDNAVKYKKPDTDPVIKIHNSKTAYLNPSPDGKDCKAYTIITIADTGIGFKEEDGERIFDLFTQLDEGRHKGSGIGLAICKKIMEMHGGFITTESEEGKGAAFNCYFPV